MDKTPYDVCPIQAWHDNYIWAICPHNTTHCYLVDPGLADAAEDFLTEQKRILMGILVTHHHIDHIGGVTTLAERFDCPVYSTYAIEGVANMSIVDPNTPLTLAPNLSFHIKKTPGHTLDHIVYYDDHSLFCGDTLFSMGCGRLFEGTAKQGYDSLKAISALPDHLAIYPAHEYTLDNLAFALHVEPKNTELQQYHQWAKEKRQANLPTLPTTLATEKKLNPFLRCHSKEIAQAVFAHTQSKAGNEVDVFAKLRSWKDHFTP